MVRKGRQRLPNGELCIQIAIKSGSFGLGWFTVSGSMGRQWEGNPVGTQEFICIPRTLSLETPPPTYCPPHGSPSPKHTPPFSHLGTFPHNVPLPSMPSLSLWGKVSCILNIAIKIVCVCIHLNPVPIRQALF